MAEGDDEETFSSPLVFRLHESAPRVVQEVLLERGWKEYNEYYQDETEWNLHWRSSSFRASDHDKVKPWQRLNHHPSTSQMTKKDCLARHLKRMKGIYGASYYEFSPVSFILPNDYTKFVAEYTKERQEKKLSYWICKPVDLSRGRGIFIFHDIKDLRYDCTVIVQKYITNPLLISGYKFDLRIYVCVTSFCPLTVYVYQEGLVRFATEKFNLSSLDNVYVHLTNTSINKYSSSYATDKERIGSGCKWTLSQFRSYLRNLEVDDALLWQRIYNIVNMTLLAIAPSVPSSPNCFELFGFDILIDDTLKPWLLEVNYSPALSIDCSHDVIVKKSLIHDIIELLNFKTSDGINDSSTSKKVDKAVHSTQVPRPQTPWRCDNNVNSQRPLKTCHSLKSEHSRENQEQTFSQHANFKIPHVNLTDDYHHVDGDKETKDVENEGKEIFRRNHSGETSFLPLHEEGNKTSRDEHKIAGSFPRKTLTSRLRERMNMPERLTSFSKSHQTLNSKRTKVVTNSSFQIPHLKTIKRSFFPLYFISDLDKRPPARVGDFILVFPFNHSSLVASRNGTADIKSIIQEISKLTHRFSPNIKAA
ncbi:probable tubulin polyglutamylase TTLL2 [Bombina bombina]|uniref:probable tubulin polyglutamylase TTLL2 n=1 Tax=Bombina bombina TaxID=8345 RepID=UPI00235AFF06|nr:probable tubulin polyglutamylase TTLL2 [Bombina bombina]